MTSALNLGTVKVYLQQQKYQNGCNPILDPTDAPAEASVAGGTGHL